MNEYLDEPPVLSEGARLHNSQYLLEKTLILISLSTMHYNTTILLFIYYITYNNNGLNDITNTIIHISSQLGCMFMCCDLCNLLIEN